MQYSDIGKTEQKLFLITGHARRDHNFQYTSLAHLLNKEYLRDCYKILNRNKAVGIDNVSWKEYGKNLEANIEHLVSRLKRKKYKPISAKRVYIPKGKNDKRPLGISAIENKMIYPQRVLTEYYLSHILYYGVYQCLSYSIAF